MSTNRFFRAACASLALVAFSIQIPADLMAQTAPSRPAAQSMANSAAQVTLASNLVAYGKTNKDPHALLTAAKILSTVGANVEDPAGKMANFDVAGLLKEAKGYAAGNDGLAKEIDAATAKLPQQWVCYYAWACNYYYCSYVYYC